MNNLPLVLEFVFALFITITLAYVVKCTIHSVKSFNPEKTTLETDLTSDTDETEMFSDSL